VVQTVRRGIAVGDLPAMLNLPCAYSAVTRKETTVLELRMETSRALVELDPGVCFRFLRLVSSRGRGKVVVADRERLQMLADPHTLS
jgi:CRP-like cAMP-binding protein